MLRSWLYPGHHLRLDVAHGIGAAELYPLREARVVVFRAGIPALGARGATQAGDAPDLVVSDKGFSDLIEQFGHVRSYSKRRE